jgi:alkylation response protein AidB-like acyl-CoA dehydrogenase
VAQPYEVYLQVLEEIAYGLGLGRRRGLGARALVLRSPHVRGSEEQKQRWLPEMLGG